MLSAEGTNAVNSSARETASSVAVSVIVPVRDNPEGIRELLDCLAAQTLPRDRFEIVIGDDGSEPALAPVIPDDRRVRLVTCPRRLSYAARNRAAASARGRVLAFCDSDCQPQPQWLEEALKAIEHADVVAGEVTFEPPHPPTVWSLLTIDMFLDQQRNVMLSRGVTANLVVRREIFDAILGFDERLPSGGDYDFVERAVAIGARLCYAPGAVVCHPTLDRVRPFLRKVWFTNHWSGVRRALRGDDVDIWGLMVFLPIYGVIKARHRALRPAFSLDRPRLNAAGIRTCWQHDVRAMPLLYFVVSYVAATGRTFGWLRGRRMIAAARRQNPDYVPEPGRVE